MPPNLEPSHPYVDSVSMAEDGEQITLSVEVTDFETHRGGIEISGQATQPGGAFATFSQAVNFDKDATHKDDGWFVNVTAKTIPPVMFNENQEITVFVSVAKVWVTVLGHDAASSYTPGSTPKWEQVTGASQQTGKTWAQYRKEQAEAAQPA
jgi:hypothetical protein